LADKIRGAEGDRRRVDPSSVDGSCDFSVRRHLAVGVQDDRVLADLEFQILVLTEY
jgi:hypothetical protein